MSSFLFKSVESVVICGLSVIHNMVECLSPDRTAIDDSLWSHIRALAFSGETVGRQVMEATTNTMRAILSREPAPGLTGAELDALCLSCRTLDSIAVKVNVINMMSVMAQRSADMEFVEHVSQLLMAGLQNETDLVVRAELLDALIDIHSADHKTDAVLAKLNLIERMKEFAIGFKREVSHQSRDLGEKLLDR